MGKKPLVSTKHILLASVLYTPLSYAYRPFPPFKPPGNVQRFIRDQAAAVVLGKAFFWDMQAGSDGIVACASCHHHGFSDHRLNGQLHPGANGRIDTTLDQYLLTPESFPFPKDNDDAVGSQGVIRAEFRDIVLGQAEELFTTIADPLFTNGWKNLRQVTKVHAPTVISAALNHRNFWDGRAQQIFNGVTPFGPHDPAAHSQLWHSNEASQKVETIDIALEPASAASQAVGPAIDPVEMSYHGRTWPKLAKKLLNLRPLGKQLVHNEDSVLASLSSYPEKGLSRSYSDLIEQAFCREWWDSPQQFVFAKEQRIIPADPLLTSSLEPREVFSLMEVNFSLLWGLAIQAYESTLLADASPFDHFRQGKSDSSFDATVQQGFALFTGKAQCSSCHREVLLAAATHENIDLLGVSISRLTVDGTSAFLDTGFFNIGLRPSQENLGIGGKTPFGTPLSVAKISHPAERLAIDGAFKAPGLRNVALRGPYFHNGSRADLDQVLDFYQNHGPFYQANAENININLSRVEIADEDKGPLKAFLTRGLTDQRVAMESAPFDHPSLRLANGLMLDDEEAFIELPAIGAGGRSLEGLGPLLAIFE